VAIDPATNVIYLTEDATEPHGLLYRWQPPAEIAPGTWNLLALRRAAGDTAGTLQAMRCRQAGRHVADLSEAADPGTAFDVEWVDVPDRLAASTSTRMQFTDDQITRSRKFEGASWGDGGAYIVASYARADDGSAREHDGPIWFYEPAANRITLKTIFAVNRPPIRTARTSTAPTTSPCRRTAAWWRPRTARACSTCSGWPPWRPNGSQPGRRNGRQPGGPTAATRAGRWSRAR
jgi:hypothetical protein